MLHKEALRRIRRRLRRIVAHARETIAIGESWADNRPEERPLDFEWARIDLHHALACLRALDGGDLREISRALDRLQTRGVPCN
jgi:hypothetical protein